MGKAYVRVAAPAAAMLLTACGGGGEGIVSTPPPPVTPSAFPLTASGAFDAISASRSYHYDSTGAIQVDSFAVAGRSSNVAIGYDASTNSYTIRNGTTSASFNSSSLTSSGYIDTYSKQPPGFYDELKLYNNVRAGASQAGAPVQLTYLSYGSWKHSDYTATDEFNTTYFLFGYATADSSMPKTGSATYATALTANVVDIAQAHGEQEVGGTATFTADFANAKVSTDLTLDVVQYGRPWGTFNGTGSISSNQFSGTFTSADPYFVNGSFAGGFFGPAAGEMGYTFDVKYGSPDPFGGASCCAPFLSWITGAVVGKKN